MTNRLRTFLAILMTSLLPTQALSDEETNGQRPQISMAVIFGSGAILQKTQHYEECRHPYEKEEKGKVSTQFNGDYRVLWENSSFRTTWEVYAVGDIDGDCKSEFFLYDRTDGTGVIFGQEGSEHEYRTEWSNNTFRTTWEIYPAGDTDGDGKTEIFLYDPNDGTGVFYGTNARGNYTSLWSNSSFRTTWEVYPAGDLFGNGRHNLFLYDRNDGTGLVYGMDPSGRYTTLWSSSSFRTTWEIYPVGDVDNNERSELFLYDRTDGTGVIYGEGHKSNALETKWSNSTFRKTWEVYPIGDADGGGAAEFLLYDRNDGATVFYGFDARTGRYSTEAQVIESPSLEPEFYALGQMNNNSAVLTFYRATGSQFVSGTSDDGWAHKEWDVYWGHDFRKTWEIYPVFDTENHSQNRIFYYDRTDGSGVIWGLD